MQHHHHYYCTVSVDCPSDQHDHNGIDLTRQVEPDPYPSLPKHFGGQVGLIWPVVGASPGYPRIVHFSVPHSH